jgi:thioredoxin-related protein
MKKIALIMLTLCVAGPAFAREATWQTSFTEAADQAARENKLLLLDFTGSDWCGWCQKLDAETFSRPEFSDYADKNLVLVRVDFPMHKSQPDELKEANRALKEQYSVRGFPTVVVVKPNGTVMWDQRGYAPGGPNAMINAVNQCRKAAGLAVLSKPATPVAVAPKPAPRAPVVPIQQPVPVHQNPGGEPKLQGILYSTTHPSAVLNGKICEEGETVSGTRVIKIERDKVTVECQGQIKVLTMN